MAPSTEKEIISMIRDADLEDIRPKDFNANLRDIRSKIRSIIEQKAEEFAKEELINRHWPEYRQIVGLVMKDIVGDHWSQGLNNV